MADAILAVSGIYAIRNTVNGKMYIGSAVNFKKRWANHKCQLVAGTHHSKKLQNAWNKYGEASFVFEIIEPVDDKSLLISTEQKFIDENDSFRHGYNCRKKAESFLGMKQSAFFLEKMSEIMRGNKYGCGHKRTPEQIKRMSEVSAGRRHSEATIEKIRANSKKLKHSDQTKAMISKGLIGNKRTLGFVFSEEIRAKVSKSLIGNTRALGMKHTEEAKKRMSETRKGRVLSAEVRARMSEAQRKRREIERESGSRKNINHLLHIPSQG